MLLLRTWTEAYIFVRVDAADAHGFFWAGNKKVACLVFPLVSLGNSDSKINCIVQAPTLLGSITAVFTYATVVCNCALVCYS